MRRGQEDIHGILEMMMERSGMDLGNNNGKGTLSLVVDYLSQHYFLFKYSILIQKNKSGSPEELNRCCATILRLLKYFFNIHLRYFKNENQRWEMPILPHC